MASNKILVIDDSGVIRRLVREMLPPGKFEILEAKDGVEGLNKILQERPYLIMLDFLLPKKSGWEVFQEIQSQPELISIPLVLMSGRKEEVTEKIPEPFQYFEFVEKPFEKKQLFDAIKSAMQKAAARPKSNVATPPPAAATTATAVPAAAATTPAAATAGSAEIQQLNDKIVKMQGEIDALKKQLGQIVTLIKQKLK